VVEAEAVVGAVPVAEEVVLGAVVEAPAAEAVVRRR